VNVKKILRVVLTIGLYAGVLVFLVPYFFGTVTASVVALIVGASLAVVCGLLRCYMTEGDCGRVPHAGRDW
jgi:membrane protein CcdC involved in cytochrome C biogenesis